MSGFLVRIVVKGRVGTNVRSVLADFDAETTPRHTVFIVGPGGHLELLAALESLDRRGVDVDRINSQARLVEYPTRTKPQPKGDAAAVKNAEHVLVGRCRRCPRTG
jgi:hypothetical protein